VDEVHDVDGGVVSGTVGGRSSRRRLEYLSRGTSFETLLSWMYSV
jgi:hypothetical protein